MSTSQTSLSRKIAIGISILLVPVIALMVYGYQKQAQTNVIPMLTEQPKDTQVANHLLPLHHWRTANGAKVFFVPTEQLPIIDIIVSFGAGSAFDGDKPGLSRLATLTVKEGSDKLSANQIAEYFESSGAVFDVDYGIDKISFSLRTLASINVSKLVDVLAEVIASPQFAPHSIDRIKQQIITKLAKDAQDPSKVALKEFMRTIYESHPYANSANTTSNSINNLTREDLINFKQQYFVESNAIITIVGGVHRNKAKEIANTLVNKLGKANLVEKAKEFYNSAANTEKRVYHPSKQTHIFLGSKGISYGDPTDYALQIASYILGGSDFEAKLFKNVREDQGLAYSIYCHFFKMKDPGPFYINLQTKTEQTEQALEIVRKILADFVNEGPNEAEIERAKQHLIGAFPLRFASNADILNEVATAAFYDLPFDYFDTYADNIRNVTKQEIIQAIQAKLDPEKMTLVIVGEQHS